jgi:hypothetical protein
MDPKPLADTWGSRDLPVLADVSERIDTGEQFVRDRTIADAVGLDLEQVRLALRALQRRGLVATTGTMDGTIMVKDIAGSAYLVTGLHPDGEDALSRLVSVLTQAAERASDPDERSRLRRAADGLVALGGQVGAGVMTAYVSGMLPGH